MILAGQDIDVLDWELPSPVNAYGNGTNTVTATTWAVLPTTTCSCSITNPHPTATLLVLAEWGAYLQGDLYPDEIRTALSVTGSLTAPAGISGAGPVGWGEILRCGELWPTQQRTAVTYELPPSATAATFAVWAYKAAGPSTVNCNYPTLRVTPLRYLIR